MLGRARIYLNSLYYLKKMDNDLIAELFYFNLFLRKLKAPKEKSKFNTAIENGNKEMVNNLLLNDDIDINKIYI